MFEYQNGDEEFLFLPVLLKRLKSLVVTLGGQM